MSTHVYHVPCQCMCMCTVDWASPTLQLTMLFCFFVNTNQEMENRESLQNIMELSTISWSDFSFSKLSDHKQLTPIPTQYSCIDTHPSTPKYPSRQMLPSSSPPLSNNNTLLPNQLAKFHTEGGNGIPPPTKFENYDVIITSTATIGYTTQQQSTA